MPHVIDMHGWPQGPALRPCSFFEDSFALFLGIGKSNQRRSAVCPIGDWLDGHDPDWSALEPRISVQFTASVPRGVTFGALCHLFDQITSPFDLAVVGCRSAGWGILGERPPDSY